MRAERKGEGRTDDGEGEQASGVLPCGSCRLPPCMCGNKKNKKQKQQNRNARTQAHTEVKQWPYLLSINSVCCRAIALAIASSAMSIFYQVHVSFRRPALLSLLYLSSSSSLTLPSLRTPSPAVIFRPLCSNHPTNGNFPVPPSLFNVHPRGTSPWQKGPDCDTP